MSQFRRMLFVSLAATTITFAIMTGMTPASSGQNAPSYDPTQINAMAQNWGVTDAEVIRQEELRESIRPAVLVANAEGATDYGGVWSERGKTFLFHFNVLSYEAQEALSGLVPTDVPAEYDPVRNSSATLEQTAKAINDRWSSETDTYINVKANTVGVVLHETAERGLQSAIADEFPGLVTFESIANNTPIACTNRTACTPWRGGTQACPTAAGGACGNFSLWARLQGQSNWYVYMITAGHLGGAVGLSSQAVYHNSSMIGTSTVNSLELLDPHSDARRVPRFGDTNGYKNSIYHTSGSWWQITRWKLRANMVAGDPLCKEGYAPADPDLGGPVPPFGYDGQQCGELLTNYSFWDLDYNGNGTCYDAGDVCNIGPGARGDFDLSLSGAGHFGLAGGDSGSPIYWGTDIFGIAADLNGNFSAAGKVRDDIDVEWCANSDCSAIAPSI